MGRMGVYLVHIGPKQDRNTAVKTPNTAAVYLMSKRLINVTLSVLLTTTQFSLLGWFQTLLATLLGTNPRALESPALGVYSAIQLHSSCNGLSRL